MMEIFGPILLIFILLVGFGKIAGVDASRTIGVFSNLLFRILEVVGEILIKIAIPVLRQIGYKLVDLTHHLIEENKGKLDKIDSLKNQAKKSKIDTMPYDEPSSGSSSKPPDFSAFMAQNNNPAPASGNTDDKASQPGQPQPGKSGQENKPQENKAKSANPYEDPPEPEIMD